MKYELHQACAAWPEMSPVELRDLADDIAANGLRDAITTTPDGKLLDGRNRALACEMAGVEIPDDKIMVYDGDPWLYSLSKNKHRRHMNADQIAIVAAKLATRTVGNPNFTIPSNEGIGISAAQAAEASGVPVTAIESAKAVLKDGTVEEIEEVKTGKVKLRKQADKVRARKAAARPAPLAPKKAPADPIGDIAKQIAERYSGGASVNVYNAAQALRCAESAVGQALARLGVEVVELSSTGKQFRIKGKPAHIVAGVVLNDKDAEIAALKRQHEAVRDGHAMVIADLKRDHDATIADKDAEIDRLKLVQHDMAQMARGEIEKAKKPPIKSRIATAAQNEVMDAVVAETIEVYLAGIARFVALDDITNAVVLLETAKKYVKQLAKKATGKGAQWAEELGRLVEAAVAD
jgi:hypothetical protein